MPILFSLVGATGVGKSRLSLELAERFDAEIIGVDSRQIYKGFTIGTAQPSLKDMARVRSEERRVGKECLHACRSRWSPYH